MFGYVRPALGRLDQEQRDAYQSVYCGLCHALGRRHGPLARLTLRYDFTFLAILLTAGAGSGGRICRRCPVHPLRKPRSCLAGGALDAAADQSVILTWHKLSDDVADHGFFAGLPYRFLRLLFRRAYRRAAGAQPAFDAQVREGLARLEALEAAGLPSWTGRRTPSPRFWPVPPRPSPGRGSGGPWASCSTMWGGGFT